MYDALVESAAHSGAIGQWLAGQQWLESAARAHAPAQRSRIGALRHQL